MHKKVYALVEFAFLMQFILKNNTTLYIKSKIFLNRTDK